MEAPACVFYHMRVSVRGAIAFLAFTFAASLTEAQQAPVASQPPQGAIALNVVVTQGDHGKPVAGLGQSSFSVLDNGSGQSIQSFRAVSGAADPVRVMLVVDDVNVPYTRLAYEREQLDKFLSQNDGRLTQPTALAIFTDTGTTIQSSYSTNGNDIRAAFDKQGIGLRDIRRSAGFYGAAERLDLSLKALQQLVAHAATQPGRKFIVWMAPGWPLISGPNVQLTSKEQESIFHQVIGISDTLRRSNIVLYTLDPIGAGENVGRAFYFEEYTKGLRKPSQAEPADLGIQVLSVQSGGRYLNGNNDLTALLTQCFADAATQYEITYQAPPAEAPNEYHRVEVHMAESGLKARTRQGYYSQP